MFLGVLSAAFPAGTAACFTSSRSVTDLVCAREGVFLAATRGGLLRRDPDGKWIKLTIADGLPSNELDAIAMTGQTISVKTNAKWYLQTGGSWAPASAPSKRADRDTVKAQWGSGLSVDGRPFVPQLPKEALSVVTTATDGTVRVAGTSDAGLWELRKGVWHRVVLDEPSGSSVQWLTPFQGSIFVSTLEEGLAELSPQGWRLTKGLSTASPRESVVQEGRLWIRHSDGRVDVFEDRAWKADRLTSDLPRKQARFLAADSGRLVALQWAGWSTRTGGEWRHELLRPELAGAATTCVLLDGGDTWIGTQGSGLAKFSGQSCTRYDERNGMRDDWITCLAKAQGSVWAGTFVGGLFRIRPDKAEVVLGTEGQNVTCLLTVGPRLFFGTRQGLFVVSDNRAVPFVSPFPVREVQALAADSEHLWIGTRTGLVRLAMSD